MKYAEVLQIARIEGHSLTKEQILERVSGKTLSKWMTRGLVIRLAPGVYTFGDQLSWLQRVQAYAKSSPDLIVCRRSAARIWGITPLSTARIEFVTAANTTRLLPDATVHESNCLINEHWTIRNGLNVTVPARTIFDLSDAWGPDLLRRTFEKALDERLVTVAEMRRMVQDLRCRGRSRVRFLDPILEDSRYDDPKNRSALERDARQLLRQARLPEPVGQHAIVLEHVTLHPDLCYPAARLAVELDGWDSHRSRHAFNDDRERDARLSIEGWTVHRFSKRTMPLLVPVVSNHLAAFSA